MKLGSTRNFTPSSCRNNEEWPNHTTASRSGGSSEKFVFSVGTGPDGRERSFFLNRKSQPNFSGLTPSAMCGLGTRLTKEPS